MTTTPHQHEWSIGIQSGATVVITCRHFGCGARITQAEAERLMTTASSAEQAREQAVGALADIGYSGDMTLAIAVSKARRVYADLAHGRAEGEHPMTPTPDEFAEAVRKYREHGGKSLWDAEAAIAAWRAAERAAAGLGELRIQMLAAKAELLGDESRVAKVFAGRIAEWAEALGPAERMTAHASQRATDKEWIEELEKALVLAAQWIEAEGGALTFSDGIEAMIEARSAADQAKGATP